MKRYDIDYGYNEESSMPQLEDSAVWESEDGEWVKYEDVKEILLKLFQARYNIISLKDSKQAVNIIDDIIKDMQ